MKKCLKCLMSNAALWLVVSVCWAATPLSAAEPVFQFSREVQNLPLTQDELLTVTLDTDVFAATQDGLSDLRLLDQAGKAVPYFLRKVQTPRARTVRTTWNVQKPAARPLENGGLEITVKLEKDDPHPTGLSLISPLRDFRQRVRVETSADGKTWEPAGSEGVIFDYSRYMDVRNDSVSFPETGLRHFRIVIDDVTVEQENELLALTRRLRGKEETERTEQVVIERRPFRIDRIEFFREERATGDAQGAYPVSGHRVEQKPDKQQTIVFVDTRRQPLTSLELDSPDRNFSRHASVEIEQVHGVTKSWQKIGEGTFSRVDFKSLKREELAITFAESRQSQYRLVIDNRDSPPLEVKGVKAAGNVYELAYLAAPDRRYQLVYGATDAEPASYDTAAIQELLGSGFKPTKAALGAESPLQAAAVPAFQWSRLVNNPLFLFSIVAILIGLLGWGLYHAVRRMDKLPTE